MRLRTSIRGNFKQIMKRVEGETKQAVSDAVVKASRVTKVKLRRQSQQAGLSDRFQKTWRDRHYPKGGKPSWRKAYMIWSNAPKLVHAFHGVTIKAGNKKMLAIPTDAVPKTFGSGRNQRRVTPKLIEQRWGIKLQFVKRANNLGLLVAKDMRLSQKTGRARMIKGGIHTKSGKLKKGVASVVMFILVPQVKMPKYFNLRKTANIAEQELWRHARQSLNRIKDK